MALTDIACRTSKPSEKLYKLSDGRGLALVVHPKGGKYWTGAYRYAGKQKSLSLGTYPEVTLLAARKGWESAREKLTQNIDPSAAKQEEKFAGLASAAQTFELTAREWHKVKLNTWKKITADNNIHRLEADIFPEFGSHPISDISPQRVLAALRKVEARGALEMSSRIRGVVSRVFDYAIAIGYAKTNPAAPLKDVLQIPEKGNFASIEVEEFPALVRTFANTRDRMFVATRVAFWLMMHTFVRTDELISAPWSEFNLDKAIWIIPAERMKKKRDHMVPLSKQAVALLREIEELSGRGYYVFPSQRKNGDHMSNGAILKALERNGYKNKMTGHGFRSLAMGAIKQELGYPHDIVDLQLAHVKANKVDAAYDRAKYLAERTRMMQDWSDYIDKLAKSTQEF